MRSWFGPQVHPGISNRIAVPIEHTCLHCSEFFERSNNGVRLMSGEFAHLECLLRMTIGSLGHQRHLCACYSHHPALDDPPGFTPREAALAAFDWYHFHRLRPGLLDKALREVASDIRKEFGFE